ncbi:MAG: hypothetical protein SFW08_10660 [Gemmatimonadaceae bacterium]|nr:hypothetical protein [Gemmatimonadaceae bacterium]
MRRALALLCLTPALLAAQEEINPALAWRTIRTPHFRIHVEPGLEAWAQGLAGRIEAVRTAVAEKVGYTPPQVIDIVVEDPLNVPNGSAWPSLAAPAMRFWATPPDPASGLGNNRGWGEILSVHEYAHLAHLLRPTRDKWRDFNLRLSPVPIGPIPLGAPFWVIEGYATLIEGQLTGSGRPNGAARPALLRQFAIEGALPAYDALDDAGTFQGGSVRYLVGSAFLEWLQAQRGEAALTNLWKRMTAKQQRSFDASFRGVFGAPPAELYGRFAAEVTARAKRVEDTLQRAGVARGALRQRWRGLAGAPAVSPNGQKIAIRRSVPGQASQVLVLATAATTPDSAELARTAKAQADDPDDVPSVDSTPRPLKRLAALAPLAGIGFGAPRWFADNERLLVVRSTPLPDGRLRPDLYVWHSTSGWLKRITSGASIREADPLPSGAQAAGVTCGGGTCSIVLIDLVTGGVRLLAAGQIDRPFAGARVSPSGTHIATATQVGTIWRPALVEIATGAVTLVGPEDAVSRYSPTWSGDSSLIVVSEAGGVANAERLSLAGGATQPLTRTTGAVLWPDRAPDGRVWFLDYHARGYDLRAIAPDSVATGGIVTLSPADAPAAPRVDASRAVAFAADSIRPLRPYGLGPMVARPFVNSSAGADGWQSGVAVVGSDVIGRLSFVAQAGVGQPALWRGGSVAAVWRGTRPSIGLSAWAAQQRPSEQRRFTSVGLRPLDVDYAGTAVTLGLPRASTHGTVRASATFSAGQVDALDPSALVTRQARYLANVGVQSEYQWTPRGVVRITNSMAVDATAGRTGGDSWQRVVTTVGGSITPWGGIGLATEAQIGVLGGTAPIFERFVIGGSAAPYLSDAVLTQRIVSPGLPFGAATGSRLARLRVGTSGPVNLFHEWYGAGETLEQFQRLWGAEVVVRSGPIPLIRLPGTDVRLGVTRATDPAIRRTVGYVSVVLRP